jgi:XTP/dITP diphosphohydrolase
MTDSMVKPATLVSMPSTVEALLVATTNPGKLREISRVLDGVPQRLVTLADLPPIDEPVEHGHTCAANALLKARYYSSAAGMPTVAEDSGLFVDALGGRPGVESARYPGATYPDKFVNLYRELAAHPRPWAARYICAAALVDAGQTLFECEATVEGEIAPEPRGTNGFGYDPIFYYPPYRRTFGEVTDEEKLVVAHRGRTFRLVRAFLLRQPPV